MSVMVVVVVSETGNPFNIDCTCDARLFSRGSATPQEFCAGFFGKPVFVMTAKGFARQRLVHNRGLALIFL
jgi:hypothetical protein